MEKEIKKGYFETTLFTVETPWNPEQPCNLVKIEGIENHVIAMDGLIITNCPSNVNDIDFDLVERAIDCFIENYSKYGFMGFEYSKIDEQISKVF